MNTETITKKLKEQVEHIDWDKVISCPICREWIVLSSKGILTKEELEFKNKYWERHGHKLREQGFDNDISLDLTSYQLECIEDLDGVLLMFKVGDDSMPATNETILNFAKCVDDLQSDKIKVIISPHNVELQKVNLPSLQKLENHLLSEKKEEPMIMMDDFI